MYTVLIPGNLKKYLPHSCISLKNFYANETLLLKRILLRGFILQKLQISFVRDQRMSNKVDSPKISILTLVGKVTNYLR